MERIKFRTNAVSQVLSVLLTLMIVLGTVATIFLWGIPAIESNKFKNSHISSLGSFDQMYNIFSSLIIDGNDAKSTANIINNNDKGSVSINTNSDSKLVVSYCHHPDYIFSVDSDANPDNDLVDGNDVFSIKMDDGNCGSLKASVHWLEPGERISNTESNTLPPKKIYDSNWCAQSFIAADSGEVGVLTSVSLYISKREAIAGDLGDHLLNVKICADDGSGFPDGGNVITSGTIGNQDVSTVPEWVECDIIPDFPLVTDTVYYIVLETSGGASSEGIYDYYKWGQTKLHPYDSSDSAFTSDDGGTNWDEDSNSENFKFPFRVHYDPSTNSEPTSVSFTDFDPPTPDVYPGVKKEYSISALDPNSGDGDQVYFKFYWGDGETEDWDVPYSSGQLVSYSHTWKEPGDYKITIQIKDSKGNVYYDISDEGEGDYTKYITINEGDNGYSWPIDTIEEQVQVDITFDNDDSIPNEGLYVFKTFDNKELEGNLKIDLFGGYHEDYPFGTIWVFDLGSITLSCPNDVLGLQQIIFKNGAVLSLGDLGNSFKSDPSFFEEDVRGVEHDDPPDGIIDIIAFRIFQIGGISTSGGGSGNYQLNLILKNNFIRAFAKVYDFSIQFHETNENSVEVDLWKKYFEDNYEFLSEDDDPPTIRYDIDQNQGIRLILDSSFVEVSSMVIR